MSATLVQTKSQWPLSLPSPCDKTHKSALVSIKPLIQKALDSQYTKTSCGIKLPTRFPCSSQLTLYPTRFGNFGGRYVPESIFECLEVVEQNFHEACNDPLFWREYRSHLSFEPRPTLELASRLTKHVRRACKEEYGAEIYIHRRASQSGCLNNGHILGQILLARRLGKTNIITAGTIWHGLVTAELCARLGVTCVVFVGALDVYRQGELATQRMQELGAQIHIVNKGDQSTKDAINEALRYLVEKLDSSYYLTPSAIGPHPLPLIISTFQTALGNALKQNIVNTTGTLPDALVAVAGGAENHATGIFSAFVDNSKTRLVGVEASGSAPLSHGTPGVLHGMHTLLLQDQQGNIMYTKTKVAGLNYPAASPQLAHWKDTGRVEFETASDHDALEGMGLVSLLEQLSCSLENGHAVIPAIQLAKMMKRDQTVVLCLD